MNALGIDSRAVDLRSLAHFYCLSEQVLELFEQEEMVDILSVLQFCRYLWGDFD